MRTGVVLSQNRKWNEDLVARMKGWGLTGGVVGLSSLPDLLSQCNAKRPDLMVVDWEYGEVPQVTEAIQKLRMVPGCRNTALFIIAPHFTPQVLGVAADYGAQKIFKVETVDHACESAIKSYLLELARPSVMRSILTRLELAQEKRAGGDVDRLAEDLFRLFPDDLRALVEYANLALRRDNVELAKHTLSKLRKNFPEDLRVANLSARICMKEGNFAEALLSVERADILSPKNIDRLQIFGDIYRKRNDLDTARAFYDQVLELNPGNIDAQKGKGHVELSEGDVNAALDLFKSAASEEELGSIFNNAAIFAVRNSDFPKAHRLYEAALGAVKDPSLRSRVCYNQGLAYCKSNHLKFAFKCFQRSFKWDQKFDKNLRALLSIQQRLEFEVDAQENQVRAPEIDFLEEPVSPASVRDLLSFDEAADLEDIAHSESSGDPNGDDDDVLETQLGLKGNGKVIQMERKGGKKSA